MVDFTDAINVAVGDAILSSHTDNLADNTEFNREYADFEHNFDISTADGTHKDITFGADSTYDIGTTTVRAANVYADSIGDAGQTLTIGSPSVTVGDDFWLGLGAAAGRIVFDSTPNPDLLSVIAANFAIPATGKLYLDGGGNSYITESAGDNVSIVTNGTERLGLTPSEIYLRGNTFFFGNAIYLDADSDSFLSAATDDTLVITLASSEVGRWTTAGLTVSGDIDLNGNDFIVDADGDSKWTVPADDVWALELAGAEVGRWTTTGLALAATAKFYLDGGGDTYIVESSADQVDFNVGATGIITRLGTTYVQHTVPVGIGAAPSSGMIDVVGTITAVASTHMKGIVYHGTMTEPTTGYYTAGVASFPTYGSGSSNMADTMNFYSGGGVKGTSGTITNWYGFVQDTCDMVCTNAYGIYVNAPTGGTSANYGIYATGTIHFDGLTASQDVQTDGSKNLTSVSDARWKNDLGLVDNALEKVRQLKPRVFTWKRSATESFSDSHQAAQPRLAGFFAQEVYSIFPEGSPGGANTDSFGMDHWGLNSRSLIALNTAAIQEVDTEVQQLRKRVSELEAKLAA